MKTSRKYESGMSMIALMCLIVLLVFCGLFAFRVVPMYAENAYVVQALKSLNEPGASLDDMSDKEIIKKLNTFYAVNNVRSDGPQNIIIDRKKSERVVVKVDYESRERLMYNIDVVASFENHLDSSRPDKCCKPLDEK